jgi:hypothetical protein
MGIDGVTTLQRLLFLSQMHPNFRQLAFSTIKRDKLWSLDPWLYLMGGEL